VFAGSDRQALGVLEAAEEVGLKVPEDLSVVGFDDVEVARYAGLTTVAQPLEESGKRGANLLLGSLEGKGGGGTERLGLRLIVRRTTAVPPETARQEGVMWHQSIATGQRGTQCPDVSQY
jgi:DNA-binding LacI/PurR family transcriptional regulator